jgi:hypothetical protein
MMKLPEIKFSVLVCAALSVGNIVLAADAAPSSTIAAEQRRVFFGELHLHTALSLDAWTFGTKLLPNDAYRFGRGETVMVPAVQVAHEQGITSGADVPAKRAWPLDFMAVTEHSEGIGTLLPLDNPNSAFSQSEIGKQILANPDALPAMVYHGKAGKGAPLPPQLTDPEMMRQAWDMIVKAANDNYEPGKFTTFIAYEWSSTPNANNIHRNVIFGGDHAPLPFTSDQSTRPEDLWTYLEGVRAQGIDVIAIPHNGNASGGLMYDWNDSDGKPIDEAYAQRRALNEPLTEIVQNKGQSDTHPQLSPNDEFANFEIYDHLLATAILKSKPAGSYVRDAFGRGLVIQAKTGANPYKYGLVGGTDIHNALSTQAEDAFAGGEYGIDPKTMLPQADAAAAIVTPKIKEGTEKSKAFEAQRRSLVELSSGGLTGVWAEENTRESIFAALKRKETFATSGTRIRLRMFGSWTLDAKAIKSNDWVAQAYAHGAPMGSDLPAHPEKAAAPSFILQAMKDPDGANLDRIQIIKVWLEGTEYKEKIFDAIVSSGRKIDPKTYQAPAVGNTVDLKKGTYTNTIGAAMLTTIWRDPEFNPASAAVYYARVLEIPTPRWSTLLAVKNNLEISSYVAPSIQERAWSSPIWYTPIERKSKI